MPILLCPQGSGLWYEQTSDINAVDLAYSMLAYIGACVGYLLLTRDMGTPFMDSLTPEQRRIKEYSVDVRTCAFTKALGITILALILLRPLRRQPVS